MLPRAFHVWKRDGDNAYLGRFAIGAAVDLWRPVPDGDPRAVSRLAGARHDQSCFVRGNDCLCPVAQTELAQHAAHVCLDRLFCDRQPACYLRIGQALGDEPQDLRFARGERGERSCGGGIGLGVQEGELTDEAAGDCRGQERAALLGGGQTPTTRVNDQHYRRSRRATSIHALTAPITIADSPMTGGKPTSDVHHVRVAHSRTLARDAADR
jgi:hypothetical protein